MEYRIKVARTTIEEFIVHANDWRDLEGKWPDVIGVSEPLESYSGGDTLLEAVDENDCTFVPNEDGPDYDDDGNLKPGVDN